MIVRESIDLNGKTIEFEMGKLARQADGAVVVTCGDTKVLVTAVMDRRPKDASFLPLTVDYREWTFAEWQAGATETIEVALRLAEGTEPADAFAAFLTSGTTAQGRSSSKAYAVYLIPRDEPAGPATIPADEAGTLTRDAAGSTGPAKAQPTDARRPMGEADPR